MNCPPNPQCHPSIPELPEPAPTPKQNSKMQHEFMRNDDRERKHHGQVFPAPRTMCTRTGAAATCATTDDIEFRQGRRSEVYTLPARTPQSPQSSSIHFLCCQNKTIPTILLQKYSARCVPLPVQTHSTPEQCQTFNPEAPARLQHVLHNGFAQLECLPGSYTVTMARKKKPNEAVEETLPWTRPHSGLQKPDNMDRRLSGTRSRETPSAEKAERTCHTHKKMEQTKFAGNKCGEGADVHTSDGERCPAQQQAQEHGLKPRTKKPPRRKPRSLATSNYRQQERYDVVVHSGQSSGFKTRHRRRPPIKYRLASSIAEVHYGGQEDGRRPGRQGDTNSISRLTARCRIKNQSATHTRWHAPLTAARQRPRRDDNACAHLRHSRTNTSRSPDRCGVQIPKNIGAGRSATDLLGSTKISYTSSAANVHTSACAFTLSIHAEQRRTRSSRRCAQRFGCGPRQTSRANQAPETNANPAHRKPSGTRTPSTVTGHCWTDSVHIRRVLICTLA